MQAAHKQKSTSPSQRGRKGQKAASKASKSRATQAPSRSNLGAAVHAKIRRPIGLTDIVAHEVSWLMGYVYVGNGTLGATDSIYLRTPAGTYVNDTAASHHIPLSPVETVSSLANPGFVPSYVGDVMKHFARFRVKRAEVELISLQPSTANSMIAQISPVRGAGDSADAAVTNGTTAGTTLTNAIAMTGSKSATSWEGMHLDLSAYVAGGSGARQNEFLVDPRTGSVANTVSIPCAMVVSGQNSTAALRGTNTHAVVCRFTLDLLDFIAGSVSLDSPFDLVLNPKPEMIQFLEAVGGPGLLKLLESRQARLREERGLSHKTCH